MTTEGTTPISSDGRPVPLSEEQCWALLEGVGLSRLAFTHSDGTPDIRPVNHRVFEREIYLRSAFDAKFLAIAVNAAVALEIDGADDTHYWSVVVRGQATQVTSEAELRRTGVEELESWTAPPKQFVVKITPTAVTGRRFAKAPRITLAVYAVPLTAKARESHKEQRGERPSPIAHFSPAPSTDD